jgi:uncharacterized caspase-like protein
MTPACHEAGQRKLPTRDVFEDDAVVESLTSDDECAAGGVSHQDDAALRISVHGLGVEPQPHQEDEHVPLVPGDGRRQPAAYDGRGLLLTWSGRR